MNCPQFYAPKRLRAGGRAGRLSYPRIVSEGDGMRGLMVISERTIEWINVTRRMQHKQVAACADKVATRAFQL